MSVQRWATEIYALLIPLVLAENCFYSIFELLSADTAKRNNIFKYWCYLRTGNYLYSDHSCSQELFTDITSRLCMQSNLRHFIDVIPTWPPTITSCKNTEDVEKAGALLSALTVLCQDICKLGHKPPWFWCYNRGFQLVVREGISCGPW